MKWLAALSVFEAATADEFAAFKKSPVSKVVKLLEDLRTKSEKDGKADEKSFMKYKCWYTSTKKEFEAFNAEASEKLIGLKETLSDIEKGYTELTPERKENEASLNQVLAEIQTMDENEEARVAAFEKEQQNLNNGIEAMATAIDALKGSVNYTPSFISTAELMVMGVNVQKIRALSAIALEDADAKELQNTLKQPDYKKLNDKSALDAYSPEATTKILKLVEKMDKTFKKNLAAAEKENTEATEEYDTLKASKVEEKEGLEKALVDATGEKGAKAKRSAELQEEIDALEAEVESNKAWEAEATPAFAKAEETYTTRVSNRQAEAVAIGEAIDILHSDDARDMFKQSFETFVQTGSFKHELKNFLKVLNNSRTRKIAVEQLAHMGNDAIKKVIELIENEITRLGEKDEDDLKRKDECKAELKTAYGTMMDEANNMDAATDKITTAEREKEEAEANIEEVKELDEQRIKDLEERTELHGERVEAFDEAIKADGEAMSLVKMATERLQEVFPALMQQQVQQKVVKQVKSAFLSTKGKKQAPPPPALAYGEETETTNAAGGSSIVGMLELIHSDIEKDKTETEEELSEERSDFDAFKAEDADQKAALEARKIEAESVISDSEATIEDQTSSKASAKDAVEAAKGEVDVLRANDGKACDFFGLNYDTRVMNRQKQREGMNDAKTILEANIKRNPDNNA